MAHLVKNPPAMQETWVQSLGWEDPLEKGKATHSSILAWRIRGCKESDMTERLSLSLYFQRLNPLQGGARATLPLLGGTIASGEDTALG